MGKLLLSLAAALLASSSGASSNNPSASSKGTLLIGNKGENTLSFVNLATGAEQGRPATGTMPHEIAVSPDGRQAAVVAYGGTTIDIFDIPSRSKLRTINLAPNEKPHGLVWLRDGRLIATTEKSQSIAVVDTKRGDAVSTIKTGQSGTHMIAVAEGGERAYTANIFSGTVSVIDLAQRVKLRDINVGGKPEGIALTPDGKTLWVGDLDGARVQAFDTGSFTRLSEVATGPAPIRVLVSPDGRWVVTSNLGSGSLTVIDAKTRKPVREIPVSGTEDARQVTILFSNDGKYIYVAETGQDKVAEVDFATGKVLRRLSAGTNGDGLAVAP